MLCELLAAYASGLLVTTDILFVCRKQTRRFLDGCKTYLPVLHHTARSPVVVEVEAAIGLVAVISARTEEVQATAVEAMGGQATVVDMVVAVAAVTVDMAIVCTFPTATVVCDCMSVAVVCLIWAILSLVALQRRISDCLLLVKQFSFFCGGTLLLCPFFVGGVNQGIYVEVVAWLRAVAICAPICAVGLRFFWEGLVPVIFDVRYIFFCRIESVCFSVQD